MIANRFLFLRFLSWREWGTVFLIWCAARLNVHVVCYLDQSNWKTDYSCLWHSGGYAGRTVWSMRYRMGVCECVSVVLGCGTKTQSLIHWCTTNVAYSIFGFRFQLYSHARSLPAAIDSLAGMFVLYFVQQQKNGRGGDGVCNCTKFKNEIELFLKFFE